MFGNISLKLLDDRSLVDMFQSCHIEIPFPAWFDDLDWLDGHIVKDWHSRHNRNTESGAHQSGNCFVFFHAADHFRVFAAFLEEFLNHMMKPAALGEANLWILQSLF